MNAELRDKAEMQPTLRIDDLCVSFAQGKAVVPAVRQVSISVAPGECVGVVGESGSGKT
jgi:ABC-type glutathione transport system ATPase component